MISFLPSFSYVRTSSFTFIGVAPSIISTPWVSSMDFRLCLTSSSSFGKNSFFLTKMLTLEPKLANIEANSNPINPLPTITKRPGNSLICKSSLLV